jgi:hypothetical protein
MANLFGVVVFRVAIVGCLIVWGLTIWRFGRYDWNCNLLYDIVVLLGIWWYGGP